MPRNPYEPPRGESREAEKKPPSLVLVIAVLVLFFFVLAIVVGYAVGFD